MILSGIDLIHKEKKYYQDARLALVTNNVAVGANGVKSRLHLLDEGFNLAKLFSPEHGLFANGIDGAPQPDVLDELTTLPVISLYGQNMTPTREQLQDIDVVLFDIPDVGCRFYTYLWTMTYVMEACAKFKKPFVIFDRPNPVGGDMNNVEGPMLDELNCSSFIGRWNIPVRHSCTLGELAIFFAATRTPGVELRVIKVENWDRLKDSEDANWNFKPTSPAITDVETALLYPGTGLLEGIYINEGRGTSTPFKTFGAPWLNNTLLLEQWNRLQVPGVKAKTTSYTPTESLYKGELCHGLSFSVTDKRTFSPVYCGITLIQLLMQLFPANIKERKYGTAANPTGSAHLDKLLGVPDAFRKLFNGDNILNPDVKQEWQEKMQPYLLY